LTFITHIVLFFSHLVSAKYMLPNQSVPAEITLQEGSVSFSSDGSSLSNENETVDPYIHELLLQAAPTISAEEIGSSGIPSSARSASPSHHHAKATTQVSLSPFDPIVRDLAGWEEKDFFGNSSVIHFAKSSENKIRAEDKRTQFIAKLSETRKQIAIVQEMGYRSELWLGSDTTAQLKAAENIHHLLVFAFKNGFIEELYKDILLNQANWFIMQNDVAFGKYVHLLPSLRECACTRSDYFNRFVNKRRENLEHNILDFVEKRFPKLDSIIHYLEFGGGGLLQTFIVITKLLLKGYTNINISLVDPAHSNEDRSLSDSVLQFNEMINFLAIEKKANLSITVYKSSEVYRRNCDLAPDIISAIDFDDLNSKTSVVDDLIDMHSLLHQDGKLFISVGTHDYIFTADCVLPWYKNSTASSVAPVIRI
jgi:hypothetical protein